MQKNLCVLLKVTVFLIPVSLWAQGPAPGDIYREYTRTMGHTNEDWRVTDPDAPAEGARKFIPNPVLDIRIDDLKGAVKAEALLDRWGGHAGTSNKKIRFNGHDWIALPELATTPRGQEPEDYHYQDNPIVRIPLEYLKEGVNTFEGTCSDPGKAWPQWGWDGIVIRIYYDASKAHPEAKIISPVTGETLREDPVIAAEVSSKVGIERVDFLAYYEGYDENGDGIFRDWHQHYWCQRGDEHIDITGHVGTARQYPYQVKWNTTWIPDQEKGAVKLLARIKDKRGLWCVTDVVEDLSLGRTDHSVKMYPASDVPAAFNVRNFQAKSCKIRISPEDGLREIKEAVLYIRTWNGYAGHHPPFSINGFSVDFQGHNHNFDMDVIRLPIAILRQGDNLVSFYSKTIHHGAEVLWPGPAFILRARK